MALTIDDIARVCHEANRGLQKAIGEVPAVGWDEIRAEMQDSVRDGVRAALSGKSPEEMHQNWCEFKQARGWVYGEEKDEDKRTHPCLVPYEELPEVQKLKDHLFSAIVHTMNFHNARRATRNG